MICPAIHSSIAFRRYECFVLRRRQLQGRAGPIEKAMPEPIVIENAVNITTKHKATGTHRSIERFAPSTVEMRAKGRVAPLRYVSPI